MYKIKAFSNIGGRSDNQDHAMFDGTFRSTHFDMSENWASKKVSCSHNFPHVLVLCDGVGSCSNGRVASKKVIELLHERVKDARLDLMDMKRMKRWAYDCLEEAQNCLVEYGEIIGGTYETTISMVLIDRANRYTAINIGDSPIYLFHEYPRRSRELVSTPHHLKYLKEMRGQRAMKGDENRLINYLGRRGITAREMATDKEGLLRPGDTLILSSDGFNRCFRNDRAFLRAVSNDYQNGSTVTLENKVREQAQQKNSDNITAIVLQFDKTIYDEKHFEKPVDALKTDTVEGIIREQKHGDEFHEFIDNYKILFEDWSALIGKRIAESEYSREEIERCMGISRSTMDAIRRQIPSNRDHLIMLAIIFYGKNLMRINYMLAHDAHSYQLYRKNPSDAIWIAILEHEDIDPHKENCSLKDLYQRYYRQQMQEAGAEEASLKITEAISALLDKRPVTTFRSVSGRSNQFFYRRIATINEKQMYPSRVFLIGLSIYGQGRVIPHRSSDETTLDAVNQWLLATGTGVLYSKNKLEAALIYALGRIDRSASAYEKYDYNEALYYELEKLREIFEDDQDFDQLMSIL